MANAEEKLKEIFKVRFTELVDGSNVTRSEIAQALGCARGHITHLTDGRSLPKAPELVKIAEYFGTSVDYLLGLVPEPDAIKPIRVVQDQAAADREIINYVEQYNPREVYLIQYSSDNARNVLRAFHNKKSRVYLLVKYPDIQVEGIINPNLDKISPHQTLKIVWQLDKLLNIEGKRNNPDIQIRCYGFPGAMRAVYISSGSPLGEKLKALNKEYDGQISDAGDKELATPHAIEREVSLLSLSLYRYTDKSRAGVIGEPNPHFHIYSGTEYADLLYNLFEETFLDLWENSIPATEVLEAALRDEKIIEAMAGHEHRGGRGNSNS